MTPPYGEKYLLKYYRVINWLTGASNVSDLTAEGCLTARARARIQPSECATMWNDLTLYGNNTDRSIIARCSLSVYSESVGLGLRPNPSRSTAKNLYLDFADFEKLG